MRLNHLDFHVPDIAETADFFIRHFGLKLKDLRGNNGLAILEDDSGLEIVLSHAIAKFGTADQVEIGRQTYHIGFILPEKADVEAVHAGLIVAGAMLSGPPAVMRGGWLFYCTAPGNILVEVGWRPG
ncbi:catechol 2,3-dioxygenase-like lactoylglutathione lyase family enzyme [Rhizobium binae]|uniref:Catechol 2,3-dioxygenase-like lactoylglutathione lyase family enzyme n=1 Tax=Rhizobium binae TaxID=1138190 RepID=A0ABV2MBK2_9HYPH|nr:VOC family protein [Rhizobium binae]MBX4951366.1 VOC family protein [Rhizobium binae]MBX4990150.1 VOC family protein [Rhizobium binae]NKL47712.1 VOC family protein [Rhizobium leguminosarum bv. viciae]QSY82765.1 VOC family protein [Rhizobium binae]